MDKLINKPLSNYDMEKLMNDINKIMGEKNRIKIMTVKQIINNPNKFKTILEKDGYVIIFLENKDSNIGHWIISFLSNGILNIFDSYGNSPLKLDTKLNDFLKSLNWPIDIRYNTRQYQKYGETIATCGRYAMFVVALRKIFGDNLTIEIIDKILNDFKKTNKKDFDHIVAGIVNFQ